MWIATALWLIAALAAVIDRDTLNAVAWFGFVAAGALSASGAAERSKGLAYLSIALLVAGVAILMGVFGVRARRRGGFAECRVVLHRHDPEGPGCAHISLQ